MRKGLQFTAFGLRLIAASTLSAAVLLLSVAASAAPPLPGAIFTTDANGDVVNGNTIYDFKTDVYLDGGPGPNAPPNAAGLPDGDYYFQVTDPSGKKLLSTDPVECRSFEVNNGIIVALIPAGPTASCPGQGTDPIHQTNPSNDAGGGIVIQLTPYLDTPNNGGVYKVWVTPVGDGLITGDGFVGDPELVDNACGNGCFHGFIPARSKTDNFKVGDKEPTFCIKVRKFVFNKDKIPVPAEGWQIVISDFIPTVLNGPRFTDENGWVQLCGLVAGTYTVEEILKEGFQLVFVLVNGQEANPSGNSVQVVWRRNRADPQIVEFFNEEVCKGKDCKH